MNYDDELRKLFTEDALDVAARHDAEDLIVTGARRARTRRTALMAASTMAVVLVIGGGIAVGGGFGRPTQLPAATSGPSPSSTTSQTTNPPSATSPTSPTRAKRSSAPPPAAEETITSEPLVLGPDGFGKVTLGMSVEEAVATGELVDGPPPPAEGCGFYDLAEYPKPADEEFSVQIMRDRGVVVIYAQPGVRTPEGLELGMPVSEIAKRYPDAEQGVNNWVIPAGGDAQYEVFWDEDDKISSLTLALRDHHCYG